MNCPILSRVFCQPCSRWFNSQACYDRHKQATETAKSICDTLVKCTHCNTVVRRGRETPEKHHCGKTKCKVCDAYVSSEEHKCYMQPVEDTGDEEGYDQLLFFDFECMQEHGYHEPNLCVVHDEEGQEWVFSGDETRDTFCEWLFTKEHVKCIVVAHNFQGYDSYFILQYLRKNGVQYDIIMRGAKVLSLSVPMFQIKFIDSLNFIPMRLANFPKTFGLTELAKGYFPHHFNKKENQQYVGPLPDPPYYDPEGMSPDDRAKFYAWYNPLKESNYVFDFAQEILTYCRSDVDILRRCCLEFRELFCKITDIDPFEKCLTIASACNLVFRTHYLEKDTIAIIPPHGYEPKKKQSILARKWLSYTAEKENIPIQHAYNGGEVRVGDYYLDGYNEETHTAYEINGCFWHGKILLISTFVNIIQNTMVVRVFFFVVVIKPQGVPFLQKLTQSPSHTPGAIGSRPR